MFIRKLPIFNYTRIKPLKVSAKSVNNDIAIKSQTKDFEWEIRNPLESLVGALVACEWSTLKGITSHKSDFQVKSFKVTKAESGYHVQRFMKGGKDNIIDDVFIEAEVETNGTQQQLNAIEQKVKNSCPIYQMLTASGVKINNTWKNVNTAP